MSVFIICKNEERIIERTLVQARKLADELVIVDSGSTDRTLEIAKPYADKLVHQDWLGYSAQKNVALSLCTQDWCLSIDADEVLTDALIAEIKEALTLPKADAYRIARKLYIATKWICYGGYYPDYQLRLFRRQLASFAPRAVHESLTLNVEARISDFKEPLEHYAYANVQELEQAFMRYADLAHRSKSIFYALIKFIYTFIWRYIFRLGFLHGLMGLQLAWVHAKYTYKKYA